MRVRVAAVAAVAAVVLTLAACGSDDEVAPGPGVPGEEAGTATVVERGDADLVVWADEPQAAVLEPVVAAFADEAEVTATVQVVPGDQLLDAFLLANTEGTGPDVVVGGHEWLDTLATNGAIDEVRLSVTDQGRYSPLALAAVSSSQTLYGLPYAMESVALFRDTDVAPKAPATVEQLLSVGERSGSELPLCVPVGPEDEAYHLHPLYSSAGGYVFGTSSEGGYDTNDLGVGRDGSLAAAVRLGQLGAQGAVSATMTREAALASFVEGRCPFLVAGPEAVEAVRASGRPYSISGVPGFEGLAPAQPWVLVQAFYVASKGQGRDLGQELVLDAFNDPETMTALLTAAPAVATMTEVAQATSAQDADTAVLAAVASTGAPRPAVPRGATVWEPLGEAERAVIAGADPETTMRAAGESIAASLR